MHRDSLANTIVVALSVCLVCSFLVSFAAVVLKPMQDANVALDKKKNILVASGVADGKLNKEQIETTFGERVSVLVVDLRTGESGEDVENAFLAANEFASIEEAMEKYDPVLAADSKKGEASVELESGVDVAVLKRRENYTFLYQIKNEAGDVEKYVFPIRGRGLWSTMKGFVAVETDFNTVAGLSYYEHGETPGLGGEIDNPKLTKQWPGKKIFDNGDVKLKVIKGAASDEYSIDGLSGATITSNGVSNMFEFWFGSEGFQAFIEQQK